MSISAKYNPADVEDKWYAYWLKHNFFHSEPDEREPYTIVIPPPNVTGVLHMGHMLNNTIQDVLTRKARMEGKNACWVPGTDHASIATEARVVAMLKEKGIEKSSLSREQFLDYAMDWKDKYGGIILEQLKKLGASCDWARTRFTMEPEMSAQVIKVFVDLYQKGYIYRGIRMVNWDPQGKTALSDDEVIYKETPAKLYHIRYQIEGTTDEWITIATVRPETILGDTAICVHPDDARYQHLHGRRALIPLINRPIPIITDGYVEREFGTGALKVTPAHDPNDYELGLKHNLEVLDILNDDGTLNEKAEIYVGQDRFVVRKKIAKELEEKEYLVKTEDYKSNVGHSERTNAVIEPKISLQWFLKMDTVTIPALENVLNDTVQLHPPKFKNMYRSWMENVRDWCISRQLWWGQQIPAYYISGSREFVVAETAEEALQLARQKTGNNQLQLADLQQDPDVLDTWFSSWLWPISVFNGILEPDNKDVNYYYPTNDLVTAPEILFFWVARMIIAGYEYRGERPFKNVYLTGIVRDKQGRKMSKSLGNSPDPLELMVKYGADGVRTGMLFSSPAGNDLLYDEKLSEQGRNFNNKIWNAFRLIKGWEVDSSKRGEANAVAIAWFRNRFAQALQELEENFAGFRISDALQTVYKLAWDDFCSWYLEMIKPPFGEAIDGATYEATLGFMEDLMKVLHPFMPFITEEIWQNLKERQEGESLCVSAWPKADQFNAGLLTDATVAFEVVQNVRNLRNSRGMSPKDALQLIIRTERPQLYRDWDGVVRKLANLSDLQFGDKPEGAISMVIGPDELSIPLAGSIDAAAEKESLLKELEYTRGFLDSVEKKLGNERFVNNAKPEVVEAERKKKADAEARIKALEESLSALSA
ncbi:valine--tRNA ligase [Cesiribacter andamanensis]|uniref:Valine--tRNA ligase n=1 Tax=Cesiribacter andamanensis AMV16 TaxID=1279009 RepID=M7NYR9_9BACT|nr:valine--tRNA ligase [Cesiribacter andamanensis]EMR03529.1 Valine--tRNA ligase [Cesiribacter andamanensis AMV16]